MTKHIGSMSYTRQKYIRSMPQPKIKRFSYGDTKITYTHISLLKSTSPIQISSGALEAARVTANKVLEKATGTTFLLLVPPFPHEVIREHKFMGFAGADRLSRGMTKSFGRPATRNAKIKANQTIIAIYSNSDTVDIAKNALKRAAKKMGIPHDIVLKEKQNIGTENEEEAAAAI